MSAPRKITAWGTGRKLSLLGGSPDFQHLYHHDDVVRELMEYLRHKRNCALMRAFIDGKVCTCGFDAALAKIAQEG